ncbi:SCP2 sterol-binding domain-containing protein, partial [Oxalobacter sp. OttesenSCG-928-P03]|nr:SCP2 sterol-binding domain-containing protein [Oxalobacter sp. OttesenSCG-928-P03]
MENREWNTSGTIFCEKMPVERRNWMMLKRLVVPVLLGKVVSRMPSYPGSLVFASAINPVLKDSITREMQAMLAGKLLRLSVTDMGLHFNFLWTSGGFVAGWHVDEPDLLISASARDFILLATRRE